jgi:hypothetical protein
MVRERLRYPIIVKENGPRQSVFANTFRIFIVMNFMIQHCRLRYLQDIGDNWLELIFALMSCTFRVACIPCNVDPI